MSVIVGGHRFGVKWHGLFHQASARRQSACPHCGMRGHTRVGSALPPRRARSVTHARPRARRLSGRAVGCGSPTIATRPGATALWWAPGRCCATRCPRRSAGAPTADPTVTRSRPTLAPTSSSTTHRAEGRHPRRREDRRSMQRRWPGAGRSRTRPGRECQPLTEKLEFGLTSRRRE